MPQALPNPTVPAPKTPEAAHTREIVREALRTPDTLDAAFELVRQPIIELASRRVSHYELLLRMRTPEGELIKPGDFAKTVRDLGADEQIDNWVAARGVLMLVPTVAEWGPQLEINLSAKTVMSGGFFEALTGALRRRNVPTDALIIDVAHGDSVEPEKMRHFSRRSFRLAYNFSLIEFERSGFEGLQKLRSLPYDFVKIDGDFIRDLPGNKADQGIVTRVARMVSRLGRRTIAMHVGDEETVTLLKEAGVDYGQGYHLGAPESLRGREKYAG